MDGALLAARGEPAAAAVTAGVELTQRELLRVLEKFGVTPFVSVGQPFDPERHEAIARVPAQGQPDSVRKAYQRVPAPRVRRALISDPSRIIQRIWGGSPPEIWVGVHPVKQRGITKALRRA